MWVVTNTDGTVTLAFWSQVYSSAFTRNLTDLYSNLNPSSYLVHDLLEVNFGRLMLERSNKWTDMAVLH